MKTIIEMKRTQDEIFRVTEREYKDETYFDLRIWFGMAPTSKGVIMTAEQWKQFKELIVTAE